MKKLFVLMLALALALTFYGCSKPGKDIHTKGEGVMTHEQYVAADLNSEVTIEAFVQAKQSWWQNKGTFYTQDKDGAYFIYEMPCTEEEYNKLTEGTKIKVTGFKSEWSGQVEITDAKWEIEEGNYVAQPVDVTALLGTDELIKHMTEKVSFKGMKVEASVDPNGNEVPFLYNWDGSGEPGSDLYFYVSVNGAKYQFTVESYLCGKDTAVYKAVEGLQIGQTIDMEGFLYWYNGPNPHITAVTVK